MKVTDPVCGMEIDTETAEAQEDYAGKPFFFCSAECHRLFKASPERYVGQRQQSGAGSRSTPKSGKDSHE